MNLRWKRLSGREVVCCFVLCSHVFLRWVEDNIGVKATLSMLNFYKSEFFFNFWILGIAKGIVLTAWHLCRCNPLSNNGYKLVYLSVFIFIGIICVYMYIVIRMNFLVLCQVVLNLILRSGLVRQVYLKNDVRVREVGCINLS